MSFLDEAEALELELRARLLGRRVVLEIGLNADLHERVTHALEPIVRGRDAVRVTYQFPALVATYLVGHAVYHYRGGGIWGSIDIRGVDQSWGERFTVAVDRLGLESFEDLVINENASRYVSRIVAHGGVPQSCVADLFSLVFHDLPHCVDAREMLARWRSRASTFAGIDRPVERFFTYGGPIAADFLNRCIDLVRHEAQSGELPSPDEIGLPPYVLTAYRDIEGRFDRARRSVRRGGRALSPPTISLDPWSGTGPVLTLPPLGDAEPGRWEVISEDLSRFATSRFDSRVVPLEPATRWQVELSSGERADDWVFDASDFGPLLLFDPATGNRIDPAAGIRSDDVWVMAFRDVELTVVGSGGETSAAEDVEELPLPVGAWSSWVLRHLDLRRATGLRVRHALLERRISVRSGTARPTIVPEPNEGVSASGGFPVFAEMPDIQLPAGTDPALWNIRIVADAGQPVTVSAADCSDHQGRVALGHLVPPHATRLQVVARGPLGDTLRREFVHIPGLHVRRPRTIVLPGEDAEVSWSVAHGSFEQDDSRNTLTTQVPETRNLATTSWFGPNGVVDLEASVPRLLWGSVSAAGTLLAATPVQMAVDELDGGITGLAVTTGMPGALVALEMWAAGEVLHVTPERSVGSSGRWVFALSEFSDTLRRSAEATFQLKLRIAGRRIDVGRLRASIDIRDLVAHARVIDDFTSVTLQFTDARPMKHRVVRLWPLDRPWRRPVTEAIADDVIGGISVSRYDFELAPGRYLVELGIDDGWSPLPTQPSSGPATTEIQIGSDDDRSRYIERLPLGDPLNVLELAALTGKIERQLDPGELDRVAGPALIALCSLLTSRYARPRQRHAVGSLLVARTDALVRALLEAAAGGVIAPHRLLSAQLYLVSRLGGAVPTPAIADSEWRALWVAAPIVAAMFDFASNPSVASVDRMEAFCGWNPQRGVGAIALGQPAGQVFAGKTLDELEQIIVLLQLGGDVPSPWLHIDAFARAQFQWIRAHKRGDFDAREWYDTAGRIVARPLPPVGLANEHLFARFPERGAEPWLGLPVGSFAAACQLVVDSNDAPEAEQLLLSLARVAPLMVTRDVLLALSLCRCADPAVGSSEETP